MRGMAGERFVGVDVSKADLEIAWDGEDAVERRANDAASCAAVAAELNDATLVVVEATGGYNWKLSGLCKPQSAGRGRQSAPGRDFARASGRLAKTDRVDARVIAILPGPCGRRRPHKSKTAAWRWRNWSLGGGN